MDILEKQLELHKIRWDLIEQIDPELYKRIAAHTESLSDQDWNGMMEVDEDVYHSGAGVSRSMLVDMKRNPDFFHYRNIRAFVDESTKPMQFGDMVHKAILEPHLLNEHYVSDAELIADVMSIKDYASPRSTKAYKETKAEIESDGKVLMPYEDWEKMKMMVEQIWTHPLSRNLLTAGMPEKSIYARDPETGLLCRVRSDYMLSDGIMIDLKTTISADESEFSKKILNMRYHVQAAYYTSVARWAFGKQFDNFVFICLENEAPYGIAIYRIDEGAMDLGHSFFTTQLAKLKHCIETNKFPSYPAQIQSISVPHWAFNQEMI